MTRFRSILLVACAALVAGCQAPATAPAPSVALDELTSADDALPMPEVGANSASVLPVALLLGERDAQDSTVARAREVPAAEPATEKC